MPIYEYACGACSHQFEQLIRTAEAHVDCPSCGSAEVRRRLSAFSFTGRSSEPSFQPSMEGGCGRCGSDTPGQCQM